MNLVCASRPARAVLLSALALASAAAWGARPGAYAVTETDSVNPGASAGQGEVRCLRPEQVDAQGFLVPRQTLAAHDSCKVSMGRADAASLQWSAACAGDMGMDVRQQNRGDDFQVDVELKSEAQHVANSQIKAQALGRACLSIEPTF